MNLPAKDSGKEEQRHIIQEIVSEFENPNDHDWAVYTLKCNQPAPNNEMKERLSSHYPNYPVTPTGPEYGPKWAETTLHSDILYYVGQSNDVVERILKHINGNGALFPKLFPPESIENIIWCESQSKARQIESQTSQDLTDLGPNPINPSPPNGNFFFTLKGRINNISDYIADGFWNDYRYVTHKDVFSQWLFEFEEAFTGEMARDLLKEGFQMWAEQASIEDPPYPNRVFHSRDEIELFWEALTDSRVDQYQSGIEESYGKAIEDAKEKPVVFAYSR